MESTTAMVQVAGVTYRIVRICPGHYSAFRIRDDVEVGMFATRPRLNVISSRIEVSLMEEVARTALREAKTSWTGSLSLGGRYAMFWNQRGAR